MSAQAPQRTNLTEILAPGSTVWITEAGGREERVRVVGQSGDIVTVTSSNEARRLRAADVARVRVREADSLLNGALIGAGVAVASGLSLCLAMEPWENCRDDIGPMLRIGAVGAAVGAGVDALIRGRKTVYVAQPGPVRFEATPVVWRDTAALQLTLRF